MNILIFIIILLVLVLVHEFGHFFAAKRFGIRVDEFGFGFPPKLFGKKYGETEYTFNLLPLGGFVKIFGETPEPEQARYGAGPDEDFSRAFFMKPRWQQAIVLVAGVFMNFLLAWVLFSFGFISGLPTSVQNTKDRNYELQEVNLVITSVSPDSPAESAGLKPGDRIIGYGGSKDDLFQSTDPSDLQDFIIENGGQEIFVNYLRDNQEEEIKILPELEGEKARIGISMDEIGIAKLGFLGAFKEGLGLTLSITKGTVLGLFSLIWEGIRGNGSLESVTGPVGLVGFVGDAYQFGFVYLLSFAALISVNLAIINLFPFPALDGGRLLFLLIEKIKGSRIKPIVANAANSIGFAILILLMLLVTYHDITKLL